MAEPGKQTATRRHDLDALRAGTMLLGILYHSTHSFAADFKFFDINDIYQAEYITVFIYALHGFRMPLFFLLSGLFTSMLWRKRGLNSLLHNRYRRIFIPCILGVFTIVPLTRWSITGDLALEAGFYHLWFLWYLCWLVAGVAVYFWIIDRTRWTGFPRWLVQSRWRLFWMIPITIIPQWFMDDLDPQFGPDVNFELLPPPRLLFYYATFFGAGVLYYECNDRKTRLGSRWWISLPLGLLIVFPLGLRFSVDTFGSNESPFSPDVTHLMSGFLQVTYTWLMVVGCMGLVRVLLKRENKTIRYISDASYWLYIAHFPLIIAGQQLVKTWQFPLLLKMSLIFLVVTGYLLFIYEVLIRYTWVGTLLNGPRTRQKHSSTEIAKT